MPKVSIIVPVYNAANTLIHCVGCLIHQTLQDIEIILVNDASTDNSWLIMQLLEEKFPDKLIIIDSPTNEGAGGARNLGLSYASGEYFGFVDADDVVDTTMYEKLYNEAIRTGYDIIDCGFHSEQKNQSIIFTSDELSGELTSFKRSELIASGGYIVTKLFKREYFLSHDFTFRHHAILEDSEIVAYAMATAKNIGNVKEVLYIYKDTNNSSSKVMHPIKYFQNCFDAMNAIYNKLHVLPDYDSIKEGAEYEMLQMYSYTILSLLTNKGNYPKEKLLSCLNALRNFRLENISKGYDNKFVINKIPKKEIDIMKQNDISPEKLYESTFHNESKIS